MQHNLILFIEQDTTSLHWLLRAHPLHYLAILSQLLIDLFLQHDQVVSSHPVQSRNSVKSHMTISSLTHFIQAYSHCTLYEQRRAMIKGLTFLHFGKLSYASIIKCSMRKIETLKMTFFIE